jgi:hypothetical protein
MAHDFLDLMAPVINDIATYYLPYLRPPSSAPGTPQWRGSSRDARDGGDPEGGSPPSQKSSELHPWSFLPSPVPEVLPANKAAVPTKVADPHGTIIEVAAVHAISQDPHGKGQAKQDGAGEPEVGPSGHQGPGRDPALPAAQKKSENPARVVHRKSNLSLSSEDDWQVEDGPDTNLLKQRLRKRKEKGGSDTSIGVQMHNIWLVFNNPEVEAAFTASQAQSRYHVGPPFNKCMCVCLSP